MRERYEDALFALLMEDVAEAEGRKALEENERLKSDPSAAMPDSLRNKCLRIIRRGYAKRKIHTVGKASMHIISKVAIIVMVLVLSFTVAFAASPTVRSSTLHWMVERYDDHMEFTARDYSSDNHGTVSSNDGATRLQVTAKWVPEGFELTDSGQDYFGTWLLFEEHEKSICVSTRNLNGNMISIDSENIKLAFTEIRGRLALLAYNDAYDTIYMPLDEDSECVVLDGEYTSMEELIKVAENLVIE